MSREGETEEITKKSNFVARVGSQPTQTGLRRGEGANQDRGTNRSAIPRGKRVIERIISDIREAYRKETPRVEEPRSMNLAFRGSDVTMNNT